MVRGAYAQRSAFEVRIDCQRALDVKTLIRLGHLLGGARPRMSATAAESAS